MSECQLDAVVQSTLAELEQRAFPSPAQLWLVGTGVGGLSTRLAKARAIDLAQLKGVPRAWRGLTLHAGELAGTTLWLLEDAPGSPELGNQVGDEDPAWVAGFPCWLAATAGASVCVHTSAGPALTDLEPGTIAIARDHLNLSGRTPLIGLSESRLGPLFPDQTQLFAEELALEAQAQARKAGIALADAVVACVQGPALETPAERRYWARAGAQVAVQGLENVLHACAHSGLAVMELVAITDRGEGVLDMAGMVQRANEMGPKVEELLLKLAPKLASFARSRGYEE